MTSVSLVLRNNLIEKAQTARNEYQTAAQTESDQLGELENALLGSSTGGNGSGEGGTGGDAWVDNGDGTITKGDQTVTIGETTFTNAEVQEALGATGGTYTGTWTVIGVEDGKLKLVSTTDVGSCTLGYDDPNAVGDSNFDRAVWSYQNAETSLNNVAEEATGISSVRSITIEDIYAIIGEENVDKSSNYGEVRNYYFNEDTSMVYSKVLIGTGQNGEEQWGPASGTGFASLTLANNNEGDIIIIDEKNPTASAMIIENSFTYFLNEEQKNLLGNLATGTYWLCSKSSDSSNSGPDFRLRGIINGMISDGIIFSSSGSTESSTLNVYAIILI